MLVVFKALVEHCVSLGLSQGIKFGFVVVPQTDVFHCSSPRSGCPEPAAEDCAGSVHLVTTARVPRPAVGQAVYLLPPGSLFRSREKKKLAHLAHRIAGDGTLARPRECLVYIGGFQYPETSHVLFGLGV